MAKAITWQDLLTIYQNTEWSNGQEGQLKIADAGVRDTLNLVEKSDRASYESDIALLAEVESIAIGQIVPVRIGSPQLRLGVLADDWNGLLNSPEGRLRERLNYFVKSDRIHSGTVPPTERMVRYRAMLKFVDLIGKSALFVDLQRSTLVFFKERRVEVPILYTADDLDKIDLKEISDLQSALDGQVHLDQRLAILGDAVTSLAEGQSPNERFVYLSRNVSELTKRVHEGYKLFASSFSYTKIRSETEAAQSDYLTRIHKTFVDIQGQLLGLPVATVVVATQLRGATACGTEALANFAVLAGAVLFVLLLIASCLNQWFTLVAISQEIERQKTKIERDFREIKGTFFESFKTIERRLWWHKVAIGTLITIAFGGALFAYRAFSIVTTVDVWKCLAFQ